MKAQVLDRRLNEIDTCDVYHCIAHFPDGMEAVGLVFVTNFLDENDRDAREPIQ